MVLGVPSYGYVSFSSATRLRTRTTPIPDGDPAAEAPAAANVTVTSQDGSPQVQFRDLVAQGALAHNASGEPPFYAAGGFVRYWDDCSSTPYLRSDSARQIITYDDPESLAMKAAFALQTGMLGVNMFDAHGDTDQGDLINAIRTALER
jgi:chitinase